MTRGALRTKLATPRRHALLRVRRPPPPLTPRPAEAPRPAPVRAGTVAPAPPRARRPWRPALELAAVALLFALRVVLAR